MFFIILIFSLSLRLFGVGWDAGYHFHPDERMIIMVAERIHLPRTPSQWNQINTVASTLNPKFFAYGSFPIYLLKFAGWLLQGDNYNGMLFVGRLLSVIFDGGTVILVYLIAKTIIESRIKNQESRIKHVNKIPNSKFHIPNSKFPLLAMFFYAISVLPIQSSHFFISDMPLTFFSTLTLYFSLRLIINYQLSIINSILLGISLGLALATKITAILLVIPVIIALLIYFFSYKKIKPLLLSLFIISIFSAITFALAMPYAIIDFPTFKTHTLEQSRMRTNPYVFPFTLQYVNTTPYWYFVKNLVLWGMGLPLGLIAIAGTISVTVRWFRQIIRSIKTKKIIASPWNLFTVLIIFFVVYFAFMGISAVKFMRYMLPIYPLLCIFGSLFITWKIPPLSRLSRDSVGMTNNAKLVIKSRLFLLLILASISIWPMMFISIYSRTQTRIAASRWIFTNVPPGSKLGLEHWDDGLPIPMPGYSLQYLPVEYPLYESDTPSKWQTMEKKIKETDYIILASNRLYVPLMKLTDCENLPPGRCYTRTAKYYQDLFAGNLGYAKVAEFTSNPQIKIGNFAFEINDQSADESFTVYDHPKVMIFKKK